MSIDDLRFETHDPQQAAPTQPALGLDAARRSEAAWSGLEHRVRRVNEKMGMVRLASRRSTRMMMDEFFSAAQQLRTDQELDRAIDDLRAALVQEVAARKGPTVDMIRDLSADQLESIAESGAFDLVEAGAMASDLLERTASMADGHVRELRTLRELIENNAQAIDDAQRRSRQLIEDLVRG